MHCSNSIDANPFSQAGMTVDHACAIEKEVERSLDVLWLGPMVSESIVGNAAAVSPAANVWQTALVRALELEGVSVRVLSYLPSRVWPLGAARIDASAAPPAQGIEAVAASYWNLPIIRQWSLARGSLAALLSNSARFPKCKVVVTYNAPRWSCSVARHLRGLWGAKWVCIAADEDIPADADGCVSLNWQHSGTIAHRMPTLHLDGGVAVQPSPVVSSNGFIDSYESRTLIFAGGLGVHTGAVPLVKAWRRVRHRDARLLVCGKGDTKQLIGAAGGDPRVNILGFLPRETLEQTMLGAFAFVNPRPISLEAVRLTFPSKVLEYLGYSRPIVSTRCSGLSPEYSRIMHFADGDDSSSLTEAIDRILDWSFETYEARCAMMHEFARSRSWRVQASRLREWLRSTYLNVERRCD